MTDKLICPFCNAELNKFGDGFPYQCPTPDCIMYEVNLPDEIWQAPMNNKIAQDFLKIAIQVLERNGFSNVVKSIDAITEPKEE